MECYGVFEFNQFKYIAYEWCENSLYNYVNLGMFQEVQLNDTTRRYQNTSILPSEIPLNKSSLEVVIKELITGVDWLHANQMCHGFLNNKSVRIKELPKDGKSIVKMGRYDLADTISNIENYGTCKKTRISRHNLLHPEGVHYQFIAPEKIQSGDRTPSRPSDMYAIGMILLSCITKPEHFAEQNFSSYTYNQKVDFINSLNPDSLAIPKYKFYFLIILIKQLLSDNPEDRPTSATCLDNPLFWEQPRVLEFLNNYVSFVREEIYGTRIDGRPTNIFQTWPIVTDRLKKKHEWKLNPNHVMISDNIPSFMLYLQDYYPGVIPEKDSMWSFDHMVLLKIERRKEECDNFKKIILKKSMIFRKSSLITYEKDKNGNGSNHYYCPLLIYDLLRYIRNFNQHPGEISKKFKNESKDELVFKLINSYPKALVAIYLQINNFMWKRNDEGNFIVRNVLIQNYFENYFKGGSFIYTRVCPEKIPDEYWWVLIKVKVRL